MVDVFSPEKRSEVMAQIISKDTTPEMLVRRGLHRLGYRFRLHVKKLSGKPDIVLPRYKTVVQVRGCFWHGHDCKDGHIPKSRIEYWERKLKGNIERDRKNDQELRSSGWNVIIVWECHCMTQRGLVKELMRIHNLLESERGAA